MSSTEPSAPTSPPTAAPGWTSRSLLPTWRSGDSSHSAARTWLPASTVKSTVTPSSSRKGANSAADSGMAGRVARTQAHGSGPSPSPRQPCPVARVPHAQRSPASSAGAAPGGAEPSSSRTPAPCRAVSRSARTSRARCRLSVSGSWGINGVMSITAGCVRRSLAVREAPALVRAVHALPAGEGALRRARAPPPAGPRTPEDPPATGCGSGGGWRPPLLLPCGIRRPASRTRGPGGT